MAESRHHLADLARAAPAQPSIIQFLGDEAIGEDLARGNRFHPGQDTLIELLAQSRSLTDQ